MSTEKDVNGQEPVWDVDRVNAIKRKTPFTVDSSTPEYRGGVGPSDTKTKNNMKQHILDFIIKTGLGSFFILLTAGILTLVAKVVYEEVVFLWNLW